MNCRSKSRISKSQIRDSDYLWAIPSGARRCFPFRRSAGYNPDSAELRRKRGNGLAMREQYCLYPDEGTGVFMETEMGWFI